MRHFSDKREQALIACALWLLVGFVGASAVAVGMLGVIGTEARPLWALATALCGGVMAGMSWRRALHIVEHEQSSGSIIDPSVHAAGGQHEHRRCFEPTANTDLRGGL